MLIEQVIPKEYNLFTNVVYDSLDGGYTNKRTKRFEYFRLEFVNLIDKILELNKTKKLLIQEEVKLLLYLKSLFKKNVNYIRFNDYSELVKRCYLAIYKRLRLIKTRLIYEIKKKKLEVSPLDNEYLFALENILQQISTLDEDLKRKEWYARIDKDIVIRKGLIIFKNLNELALSIAKNDHESIKDISQSILSYDKLSFSITNKFIS